MKVIVKLMKEYQLTLGINLLDHLDLLEMAESIKENQFALFLNSSKEKNMISFYIRWSVTFDHHICHRHHCINPIAHMD